MSPFSEHTQYPRANFKGRLRKEEAFPLRVTSFSGSLDRPLSDTKKIETACFIIDYFFTADSEVHSLITYATPRMGKQKSNESHENAG